MPQLQQTEVPYPQQLRDAVAAFRALLNGNRLTTFLPRLEHFNSSLQNLALMPMLMPSWTPVDMSDLEIYLLDYMHRRAQSHGLPSVRSTAGIEIIRTWHNLLLKLLIGAEQLTGRERDSLERLYALMDAMAHATYRADPIPVMRQRIETYYTTARV